MLKILSLLFTFFIFFGCFNNKKDIKSDTIVVSTFPIYDILENITKNSIEIQPLIPFSKDIHSYEPTPKDMVILKKSKLVIVNGAGLEPWLKKFDIKQNIFDLSRYVILLDLDENHDKEDEDHHHDSKYDPHFWLDIENQIKVSKEIAKKLYKIFPEKKDFFQKNLEIYIAKLKELDMEYKKTLSNCKVRKIVVNHNAFSYLGKKYNFDIYSISGISSNSNASAKSVKDVINLLKSEDINIIFYENFSNKSVVDQISKDTHTKAMSLDTLSNITNKQAQQSLGYIDIMKQNLKKLKEAMQCD